MDLAAYQNQNGSLPAIGLSFLFMPNDPLLTSFKGKKMYTIYILFPFLKTIKEVYTSTLK